MPFQAEEYFQSLSAEFNSLKNRIRQLVQQTHFPTDGEFKESVLRNILRRSAPKNITIGRGFIVGREHTSSQIDVLIYDNSCPTLYSDGDLVFISPSGCLGIVEVKTRVDGTSFRNAVTKLGSNSEIARNTAINYPLGRSQMKPLFVGLFVYEPLSRNTNLLPILQEAARGNPARVVNHISIGNEKFIKFWLKDPMARKGLYKHWHEYRLQEMSQGYFIHNCVTEVSTNNSVRDEDLWFPEAGKERRLVNALEFDGEMPRQQSSVYSQRGSREAL